MLTHVGGRTGRATSFHRETVFTDFEPQPLQTQHLTKLRSFDSVIHCNLLLLRRGGPPVSHFSQQHNY